MTMLMFLVIAIGASSGAVGWEISTCPQSALQCAESDFQVWKCCPDGRIAYPPVESCRNGTLVESKCFSSISLSPGNAKDAGCDGCSTALTSLSLNLTKPTRIYAVVVSINQFKDGVQSLVSVQVKFQEQSNVTTLTDCALAGGRNELLRHSSLLTFYCGQPSGVFGDGVRVSKSNTKAKINLARVRIYEHPGVGCGRPGVDAGGTLQPEAEYYPIGSRVRYSCSSGTILQGPAERTCSNEGRWDGPIPRCIGEVKVGQQDVGGSLKDLLAEFPCLDIRNGSLTFRQPGLTILRLTVESKGPIDSCLLYTKRKGYLFSNQLQLETRQTRHSIATTVYRSVPSRQTPDMIDEVAVHCPSDVRLCRIELTTREDSAHSLPCPSPDAIANGHVALGHTGLAYTCHLGYELDPDNFDQPVACENGKWASLPPVCTRILCDHPQHKAGSHWILLNRSTTEGSLVEYRSLLDPREHAELFVCDVSGHWSKHVQSGAFETFPSTEVVAMASSLGAVLIVVVAIVTVAK